MKFEPSEPRPYFRHGKRQPGRWEIDLRGVLDNGLKVERQRRVFPLNPAVGKIGKRQAAAMAWEEWQRWNRHGQVLRPGETPALSRTGAMKPSHAPTFAQFAPDFMEFCASVNAGPRGPNSPAALEAKEVSLRIHVLPVFGSMRMDQLHRRDVDRYVIQKAKQGRSVASIRLDLGFLRRMLVVAKSYELIDKIPEFRVPAAPPGDVVALAPDEAKRLRESAVELYDRRLAVLFELYLRTGLRCGEALALFPSDFDLDAAQPTVQVSRSWSRRGYGPTKGKKVRVVPLAPSLARRVDELLRERELSPRSTTEHPPGLLSSEFEEWLWKCGYTMPASAFEDCFTVGGMAATATHGVGLKIGTVSDMVVGMTFVDGHGNVRRWDRETCSEDELAAIQCGLGCLGLIYDITFEIEPLYETFHEAMLIRYEDYFADNDQARANLRELHESHTSVEFFWWPFRFKRLPLASHIEINPNVFVLATCKQIPSDARPRGLLRRALHLEVADMISMVGAGTAMRALNHLPQLAYLNAWAASFTNLWVSTRSGAYRMPQYDANHFVNATAVEFMTAMASEWSVPFRRDAPIDADDGYERLRQSFALLHDLVVEAFEAHPIRDPRATPVAIAVEMRTLAASSALLSPGYQPEQLRGQICYAAPELVTTAGHPAWEEFARKANLVMTTSHAQLGDRVRCHQAKPCHRWPHPDHPEDGMRGYLREQYRAAGSWDRFLAVRAEIDPDGVFLNDYLRAWFELPAAGAVERERLDDSAWAAE